LSPQEQAERERRRIRASLLDDVDVPDRHQALDVAAWIMIALAIIAGAIGILVGLSDLYGGNGISVIVGSVIAAFSLVTTQPSRLFGS